MCTTNGLIKIPRDRFPELKVGISVWGNEADEKNLRNMDTFSISSKHYEGDSNAYYLYTLSPDQVGRTEQIIKRVKDLGLKVHIQLLMDEKGGDRFHWDKTQLSALKDELDSMLEAYPGTFVSTKYYNQVLTTGRIFEKTFGWDECPSVSVPLDNRNPKPKRLANFVRWAPDLKTMHECCVSKVRNCEACRDGAALMSWIMVNKRSYIRTSEDLKNWIEVVEIFATLNGLHQK